MTDTRVCKDCGYEGAASDFALSRKCKPCMREYKRKWAAAHPESGKAWVEANREKVRGIKAAWSKRNPEYEAAKQREYRLHNPERYKAIVARYEKSHPEGNAAKAHLRRARKAAAPGSLSAADIKTLREMSSGLCAYCLKPAKLAVDHVVALSRGGANDITNCVMACKRCNSQKHAHGILSMLDPAWRLPNQRAA